MIIISKLFNQLLDIFYVILQRRISGARYLMTLGLNLFTVSAMGSLAFKFERGEYSFVIDTASDPRGEIFLMGVAYFSLFVILVGCSFEVHSMIFGESAAKNRSKSIDLRSLDGAAAPTLCDTFNSTIEPAGIHEDLFLCKSRQQDLNEWLRESCRKFESFYDGPLQRLNYFEPGKALALGALAHIPHCFTLGYLVGNKRLVNYFCWDRNNGKQNKGRWIDCRDARSRGQDLQISETIEKPDVNDENVTRLGISVEVSFSNNNEVFLTKLDLDRAISFHVKNKYVGNMFSDVEQSKFVEALRNYLNNTLINKYPNIKEIHITIMAQASLVMRIGAEFNQNHLSKDIFIHHYEQASYPWAFKISPDKSISHIVK